MFDQRDARQRSNYVQHLPAVHTPRTTDYTLRPIVVPAGSAMVTAGEEFRVRAWVRLVMVWADQRSGHGEPDRCSCQAIGDDYELQTQRRERDLSC